MHFNFVRAAALVLVATGLCWLPAGCEQDVPVDTVSYFREVDRITNLNSRGVVGVPFDLNTAVVLPIWATQKDIVWTVAADDDGETGVTTADIVDGVFTPNNTGELKLVASISGGLPAGETYTQNVSVTFIAAEDYVSTSGIAGLRSAAPVGLANLAGETVYVEPNDDTWNSTYTAIEWAVLDPGTTGAEIVNKTILKTTAVGTAKLTATVAYGRSIEATEPEARDWSLEFDVEVLANAPDDDDDFYEGVDKEPVGVKVTSMELDKTDVTLEKDGTVQLAATVVPSGVTVRWESSKPGIFSVTQTGLVTALTGGQAVIRASAGGKSSFCTVKVPLAGGLYIGDGYEAQTLTGEGTMLAKALAWIKTNGANDGQYKIVLGENEDDETTANGF